ncbi:carbohydrate esterase family 16 protein [Ramaria rubella]|nr:carbohydrate esterase family 16 protein [Ramaria rubella]
MANTLPRDLAGQYNCSLQLAYVPECGSFKSSSFINSNSGVSLSRIKNIIPFGDSWTAMNDSTGVFPPPPAVITGTNPMAGGRASNGPTWTEYIANDRHSPVHPYAIGGAVTNLTLWPTAVARNISISTFINQTNVFLNQRPIFDPESSLFVVFFGINDYTYSETDGSQLLLDAAKTIDIETLRLIHVGARNILTVGVYFDGNGVQAFEDAIFKNVGNYREKFGINVAYTSFLPLWSAIDASPAEFGFTSLTPCLIDDSTTVGACDSPSTYIYWQHAHPSTCTHRLMADYVERVLETC